MRRARWRLALVIAAAVLAASGCGRVADHDEHDVDEPASAPHATPANGSDAVPRPVKLEMADQLRLGVVVSRLGAAMAPSGASSTARVLDPGPLLALDGELAAAEASLGASRAEAERTRRLFAEDRTASARALEAATSQALADRQRVASAQRRIALEWGEGIASLAPQRRTALLNDLAQVRAELIRVELPPEVEAPARGSTVAVRESAEAAELNATVLGTLPSADPRLQTRGLLVELRGSAAHLPIGSMLLARFPQPGHETGVLLPRGALIRKDSRVWAYLQTSPTTFLRREVAEYQILPEGWLVRSGFMPGDKVVTGGAAALLAIESPAADAD